MKKELVISIAALLFTVAPVYAVTSHPSSSQQASESHGSTVSQEHKVLQSSIEEDETTPEVTPTLTTTPTPTPTPQSDQNDDEDVEGVQAPQCDPSAHWKNHGEY